MATLHQRIERIERGRVDLLAGFGDFSDARFAELVMSGEQQAGDALRAEYPRFCQFFKDLLRVPQGLETPVLSSGETGRGAP